MTEQLHLVLNPVRADRTDEFERFLAEVVVPAVRAQRPDLMGRWRVMRSTGAPDAIVTYAFLFDGGNLEADWELGVLLGAEYGDEEADRLLEAWVGTFAPLEAWSERVVTSGRESGQPTWTLAPVDLD